jgi:hypothetical protein
MLYVKGALFAGCVALATALPGGQLSATALTPAANDASLADSPESPPMPGKGSLFVYDGHANQPPNECKGLNPGVLAPDTCCDTLAKENSYPVVQLSRQFDPYNCLATGMSSVLSFQSGSPKHNVTTAVLESETSADLCPDACLTR